MKEELLSFIRKHSLVSPGDRVVVAFSGGADSTCLLHLLHEAGTDVTAAHLHHSQRPEGDADVEHCRAFCESLEIEFFAGEADVPAVARAQRIGIEESGRKLRYEFLQMVAAQGYQRVATGHTMNDNVETMLLNLARGAGMKGLTGIPVKRGNIIRPILFLQRAETQKYCEEHALRYVQDSYNEDETFARNLVRGKVVPVLERVNAAAIAHAAATAAILTEEDAVLDALAGAHLASAEIHPAGELAFIESRISATWKPLRELPIAILRRCIRIAAGLFGGELDSLATQSLAEAIYAGAKASFTCDGGALAVTATPESWSVTLLQNPQPFREMLTLPGETIADDLGWSLAAWRGRVVKGSELEGELDEALLKGNLFARSLKPTDKVDPVGRGDKKPLAERLARAGVPEAVRARIPIVCDLVGPVWAPLVGVDRRAAVQGSTQRVVSLKLSPVEPQRGNSEAV